MSRETFLVCIYLPIGCLVMLGMKVTEYVPGSNKLTYYNVGLTSVLLGAVWPLSLGTMVFIVLQLLIEKGIRVILRK